MTRRANGEVVGHHVVAGDDAVGLKWVLNIETRATCCMGSKLAQPQTEMAV